MSQTHERRAPQQGQPAATHDHHDTTTPPSDVEALTALRTLRMWLGLAGSSASATYDADHLPAGIGRDAYLRRHRARMRDAVAGWTRVGHARLVTSAAWDADVASETAARRPRPRLALVPAPTVDDLDAALGIVTRAR